MHHNFGQPSMLELGDNIGDMIAGTEVNTDIINSCSFGKNRNEDNSDESNKILHNSIFDRM